MKDLKAPLMIAVPAAITILGIVWFLRKLSKDDKKDERTSSKSPSPENEKSLKTVDKETPNVVKKEGITLTQRKIPETGDGMAGDDSLTEKERAKVKEIVDAAIGAGLKEAKGEVLKAAASQEERHAVVEEQMVVASATSVQCSVNNNLSRSGDECTNADSKDMESRMMDSSSDLGNYIDNQAIADFFTTEQTTSDKRATPPVPIPHTSTPKSVSSSSANVVNASPSSSHHHVSPSSSNFSQSVPSSHISKITKPTKDGASADLSTTSLSSLPSPLPSDITSKDSLLENSSVVSDYLVSSDNNLSSSVQQPSASAAPTKSAMDSSQVGPDSSAEQQEVGGLVKTTESSSSHNSSSPVCDSNSVGSSDSGRGGSEQDVTCPTDSLIHFDFNMPSELCGRLIGKKGYNINQLKAKSGANVSLTHNPVSADFQICQVVGTQAEIDEALRLIRMKFPLEDHPRLTMAPVNLGLPKQMEPAAPVLVPDNMQLSLPDGASVEVYVSTIVDAGHVFVQQPTHRTFMSLERLTFFLNSVYGQDDSIPALPQPIECGVICVCENEGSWYRAMVMSPEDEYGQCQVKFVDYGGYTQLPISCIKQIRADFMNLPFQAVECFVANIAPLQGEEYFSTESTMALSEMSQMKLLQCQVVARNEIGTPYIHLYVVSPETNTATLVNRALVNNGLVRWVEIL